VARELSDGQELDLLGGLEVLHTPGHTGGHLAFRWPRGGVLFAGDAGANMWNRLGIAPLNEDDEAAWSSFARLARMEFSTACFGHGRVISRDAADRFRRRLRRRH
jgi:glyoxylase-like metal-dependent hydrolase (beta-lactamase superfamily II)